MSTYLQGVTYAEQHVTPSDDAAVYASALTDGIATGCAITKVGSTLTIAAGKIIACGRVQRVASSTSFTVNGASSGYARLLLTIDLSKSVAQQVALDVEYSASIGGFPSLTQNDINNGGTKYQTVICMMALDNGIDEILWTIGRAHGKARGVEVTIPTTGWSSNAITLYVDGVTPDSNVVCTYKYSDKDAYLSADLDVTAQGWGTLTFHASDVPSASFAVNILLN